MGVFLLCGCCLLRSVGGDIGWLAGWLFISPASIHPSTHVRKIVGYIDRSITAYFWTGRIAPWLGGQTRQNDGWVDGWAGGWRETLTDRHQRTKGRSTGDGLIDENSRRSYMFIRSTNYTDYTD